MNAKPVAVPDWVPDVPAELGGKTETNVAELAREILNRDHFARDPGGRLYVFRNGVYLPSGELVVRQRVKGIMNHWGLAENWTAHKANEVVEYIRVDSPELWIDPPADSINLLT